MEIFGVGPLEFLLVLVLALVILGPEDMVGTSRRIGQWIYRAVRSPTWRAIISTTQDLRELPQKIVRDAGIEEAMNEVKDTVNEARSQVTEATMEVNSEMQAATREMNSEMQVASQQVSQDMQLPGAALSISQMANGVYPGSDLNSAATQNQIRPEQALPSYPPGSLAGLYIPPANQNPLYYLPLADYSRSLATGPRTAANLDRIVPIPQPPPPSLAAPELISGALGFLAVDAAPADLEVPFVFADPTDYPDPEPAAVDDPSTAVEGEAAAAAPDEPAELEGNAEPQAPQAESTAESITSEVSGGIDTDAMERRMRELDEAFQRLDASPPQQSVSAPETEIPASDSSES